MSDAVNKPNHYMLFADGTEAIDVIRATLTPEEFRGYCKGNVLKYRLRAGKKDKLEQDIAKADTYAKMLADSIPASMYASRIIARGMDKMELAVAIQEPGRIVPTPKDQCGPLMDCSKCPSPCR